MCLALRPVSLPLSCFFVSCASRSIAPTRYSQDVFSRRRAEASRQCQPACGHVVQQCPVQRFHSPHRRPGTRSWVVVTEGGSTQTRIGQIDWMPTAGRFVSSCSVGDARSTRLSQTRGGRRQMAEPTCKSTADPEKKKVGSPTRLPRGLVIPSYSILSPEDIGEKKLL